MIIRFIKIYIALVIIFLLTLTISCLIPSSWQKKQIHETIQTFKKEGVYPSIGLPIRRIILDNYTDALMVNTSYSVDSHDPFQSALTNARYDGITDNTNQIASLEKHYNQKNIQKVGYERYWHGYLIFMRPLLVFFSYSTIRLFMTIVLYGLWSIFMYLVWEKLGKKAFAALFIAFVAVDFFYISQSLQFSSVFLIGLCGGIYLLKNNKKMNDLFAFFFIIGALTSFFDLLTAPLVSLGMLLIVALSLRKETLKTIFLYCLTWSVGYLLLWFSKWLIVELLFTPHAIAIAIDQIVNRTVNQADAKFSHIGAVSLNFWQLVGYDKRNKFVLLFAGIIFGCIFLKYISFKYFKKANLISLIFIALIPYSWYFIVANHSYLHVWFTYRDQFVSVASLFLIAFEFMDFEHMKRDIVWLRSFGKSTSKRH